MTVKNEIIEVGLEDEGIYDYNGFLFETYFYDGLKERFTEKTYRHHENEYEAIFHLETVECKYISK